MDEILEEVLKLSEKELNTLDKKQRHNCIYCTKDSNTIYKVVHRFRNQVWLTRTADRHIGEQTRVEYINPLTKKKLDLIKKKRVGDILNNLSTETLEKIIKKTALEVYNEDCVDINTINPNEISVTIHYPEITITNSAEQFHTIRDLYLNLIFRKEVKWILKKYSATRGTVTTSEIIAKYSFSHLSGGETAHKEWVNGFCFGTTEFSELIKRLIQTSLSLSGLFQLFYQFNEYFKWESIEGAPYTYIGNINSWEHYSSRIDVPEHSYNLCNIVDIVSDLKYEFNNSNIKLLPASRSLIADKLKLLFPDELVLINTDGECVEKDFSRTERIDDDDFEENYFYSSTDIEFKGELVQRKIIKEKAENIVFPPKQIAPEIIDWYISEIEDELTKIYKIEKANEQL